jgi:hypothetical protein
MLSVRSQPSPDAWHWLHGDDGRPDVNRPADRQHERPSTTAYSARMALSTDLASTPGIYFGTGDGVESGAFVARIQVAQLPNGGAAIDYEATSIEQGVQHREHSMLVAGPDGRDRLFVAHSESPFVTEMVETEIGSGRFAQREPFGPYAMEIVIAIPEPDRIIYAWWWGADGEAPVERSKADARRQ